MTILLPLTLILAGISYFAYQIYQQKTKKTPIPTKPKIITRHCTECGQEYQVERLSLPQPLSFDWKSQICFKIFGRKTWIRYRQGYTRARYAINYFYPTCWIGFYCFFSILIKLLTKTIWQVPLNWFFWFNLIILPICGLSLFYQIQKLKQIPLQEKNHVNYN